MQIVIDIDDGLARYIRNDNSVPKKSDYELLVNAIYRGTPLPENPTNGGMIMAMFNVKIVDDFYKSVGIKLNDSNYIQFNKDWWNAPYKEKKDADSN